MKRIGSLASLLAWLAGCACGGPGSPDPDAGEPPPADAAPDAPVIEEPIDCEDPGDLVAAVGARLPAGVQGWALGVAVDGEVLVSHAEGVTCNGREGLPVTTRTAFLNGSALSQPAAVLEAARDGAFAIDDPLSPDDLALQPESWGQRLTVGDALRSSSGLRWGWDLIMMLNTPDDLVEDVRGQWMWAPPGWMSTVEPWSNELLARRLEGSDPGRSFADVLRARVLEPVDMPGTRHCPLGDLPPEDTCGHIADGVLVRRVLLLPTCAPVRYGVERTTLEDLLALGDVLTHRGRRASDGTQALGSATVDAMFAPQGPENFWDHSLQFTNGLQIVADSAGSEQPVAVLEGYGAGHATAMVLRPARPETGVGDLVLVLLTNLESDRVSLALTPLTRCFAGMDFPTPGSGPTDDGASLRDYGGEWGSVQGETATVDADDESRTLRIEVGGATYTLRPFRRNVFESDQRGEWGRPLVSFWRHDGALRLFTSLDMPDPFPKTPFWRDGEAPP